MNCKIKGSESIYSIYEINHEYALIYPAGGGFRKKVTLDNLDFIKESELDKKEYWAEIEVIGGSVVYPCLSDPLKRWNGWALPFFSKEVVEIIMKEADYKYICRSKEDKYDIYSCNWNENLKDIEEQDYTPVYKSKDNLFYIDGWTWSIFNNEGQFVCSDGACPEVNVKILKEIEIAKDKFSMK